MTIVNNFVNDLVYEDEVLPNGLLVEHSAVVPKDLHHSVDDVHDKGGGDIVLGSRHKVDAKFLGKKVVQTLDVLKKYMGEAEFALTKDGGGSPSHRFTLR
jgi:hypothetical protein